MEFVTGNSKTTPWSMYEACRNACQHVDVDSPFTSAMESGALFARPEYFDFAACKPGAPQTCEGAFTEAPMTADIMHSVLFPLFIDTNTLRALDAVPPKKYSAVTEKWGDKAPRIKRALFNLMVQNPDWFVGLRKKSGRTVFRAVFLRDTWHKFTKVNELLPFVADNFTYDFGFGEILIRDVPHNVVLPSLPERACDRLAVHRVHKRPVKKEGEADKMEWSYWSIGGGDKGKWPTISRRSARKVPKSLTFGDPSFNPLALLMNRAAPAIAGPGVRAVRHAMQTCMPANVFRMLCVSGSSGKPIGDIFEDFGTVCRDITDGERMLLRSAWCKLCTMSHEPVATAPSFKHVSPSGRTVYGHTLCSGSTMLLFETREWERAADAAPWHELFSGSKHELDTGLPFTFKAPKQCSVPPFETGDTPLILRLPDTSQESVVNPLRPFKGVVVLTLPNTILPFAYALAGLETRRESNRTEASPRRVLAPLHRSSCSDDGRGTSLPTLPDVPLPDDGDAPPLSPLALAPPLAFTPRGRAVSPSPSRKRRRSARRRPTPRDNGGIRGIMECISTINALTLDVRDRLLSLSSGTVDVFEFPFDSISTPQPRDSLAMALDSPRFDDPDMRDFSELLSEFGAEGVFDE